MHRVQGLLQAGDRRFLRNLLTFMSGRGLAALITISSMPLIARLYSPEHFGVSALFVSITMVLISISGGAYDRAIVICGGDDDGMRLALVALFFVLLVGLALSFGSVAIYSHQALGSQIDQLGAYVLLIPLMAVIGGAGAVFSQWLIRKSNYRENAKAEVLQAAMRSGVRLVAAFPLGSSVGLLIWSVLIAGIAKLAYLSICCSDIVSTLTKKVTSERIKALKDAAVRFSDFPRYNLPTTLVLTATSQLPVFLLGVLFSPATAGFYVMADRLINAPFSVLGNSLRSVLLPTFSRGWTARRNIKDAFNKAVIGVAALSFLPGAIVFVVGEELFSTVLGQKWAVAGQYAQILAPTMVVALLNAPFHAAAQALRQQRPWFWLEMTTALGRVLLVPIALYQEMSDEDLLFAYTWVTVVTRMTAFLVVYRQVAKAGRESPVP